LDDVHEAAGFFRRLRHQRQRFQHPRELIVIRVDVRLACDLLRARDGVCQRLAMLRRRLADV